MGLTRRDVDHGGGERDPSARSPRHSGRAAEPEVTGTHGDTHAAGACGRWVLAGEPDLAPAPGVTSADGPGPGRWDCRCRRWDQSERRIGLDQPETGAEVESGVEPGGRRIVRVDGRAFQNGINGIRCYVGPLRLPFRRID